MPVTCRKRIAQAHSAGSKTVVAREFDFIEVERIFLYEENPRHEPIESEPEIIEHLCKDEQVLNLARSIAELGPNPLELVGLVQIPGSGGSSAKKSYQVWEGNRRICAVKLLNDTDLAPAHLRKDFVRLAAKSKHLPIKKINSAVFDDHDDLKTWMGINHNGAQAGAGRLDWDAQQKERHIGTGRNRVALAVLDAAQGMGLISKEERDGKLTTAQRFLNSSIVREALGIDTSNKDDITYNRPPNDLKKQLGRFISDLKRNIKVTSRHNRDQIDSYGRRLARSADISDERIQPRSLKSASTVSTARKAQRTASARKPKKKDRLSYNKEFALALEAIGNEKLDSLHYSVCSVPLDANTPLLTIGVWAFVESLTALAGKNADTDFLAYFSNQRLNDLGFANSKKNAPLKDALQRIQRNGNATKHHEISASFDGKQLANDLATITPLLMKTLTTLTPKK